jgi:hypothetical protein
MTTEQINEARNALLNAFCFQADHQEKIEKKYGIGSDFARYQEGCTQGYREALRILALMLPEDFNIQQVNVLINE